MYILNQQELLSIVKRIEELNAYAGDITADIKEIYTDAKSAGFDPKYIKACIKLRKKDSDEIDEEDELMKMYRKALDI